MVDTPESRSEAGGEDHAGKKKKRLRSHIDPSICAGCKTCYLNCPRDAVSIVKKGLFSSAVCRVDPEICIGCGICTRLCITGAISLQ